MNYIARLQEENRLLNQKIADIDRWRKEFLAHLASEKFQGVDSNGERKDWISTQDVRNLLAGLSNEIFR